MTGGKGASCAVECAGGELPRAQAVRSTKVWGRIALVAVGGNLVLDAMKDLIGKQRQLLGSFTFSEVEMKACANFIATRGIEVDRLFTDTWRLDQAAQAYAHFDQQAGGKGVFLF
ncbi:zinc-binding dehydrogenase [Cupriavidus pinatubonensis]|uniref:zinc-binding dehydrogenase n=1 Tax=Cupriavidus pinatubonensis TaxID=248026 RepID=UPI001FD419AD|nr:zinc-binding dehydrogenase [Cupriavidus pinatubonensis]